MKPKKPKMETWRYMGRIRDGKTLFQSYQDEDGEFRVFKKLPASSPGSLYEVEVKREKDGGIIVHGSPAYIFGQDISEDKEIRLKAAADDRAISIQLDTERAEKAGAYKELEENLEALRSLYVRQKGGRRAAFLAHVIQRLTKR
jgi:hypothetical protein